MPGILKELIIAELPGEDRWQMSQVSAKVTQSLKTIGQESWHLCSGKYLEVLWMDGWFLGTEKGHH